MNIRPMADADCARECSTADEDRLNERCGCAVVDVGSLRDDVIAGLPGEVRDASVYAGLFSPYAVFVAPAALKTMADVAAAIFSVATVPAYADRVLAWAPPLARVDPGSAGGVLGLDFHLTVDGPRLIEVNTNPGGLLLNARLVEQVASCAPAAWRPPFDGAGAADIATVAWLDDLQQQRGSPVSRIAIVDDAPEAQFLYPEFELYARKFREHGVDAVIRAPQAVRFDEGVLTDALGGVDAVYNRLTDFGLQSTGAAAIARAYVAGRIALSPHPRAHALVADKRNLTVLGRPTALAELGVEPGIADLLSQVVPATTLLVDANRERFWAERKHYFFKPAHGFGSRGSYRGDKLTRGTWASMVEAPYIAQALVPPGVRIGHGGAQYKVDVRCYASAAGPILFAARLYQGQTTNMRTEGGGFAAVLTANPS
jgi:hypothetical protein